MKRKFRSAICALTAVALMQLPVYAEVVKVPAGTTIMLKTVNEVSSSGAVGDAIAFVVVQDVLVNGKVVAKAGAPAVGEVSALVKRKFFGIPAKISVMVRHVTMADSTMVFVNSSKTVEGDDQMVCSIIGTILCLLPALIRGGDAKIPAGSMFPALVMSPSDVSVP